VPRPNAQPGPRYHALLQILRTAEALWNSSRVFFSRWDLSPSQFNVLNLLSGRSGGVTQSELSRELITHRSNITGLVDRLEARGLVRRTEMPGDRRAFLVQLTPAGRRLLEEILPCYHAAAEEVWGGINTARAVRLARDLGLLAASTHKLDTR
jgi:MarR family transcriptional regulator, negative regulator of the multidrug operon emrRAB